MQGAAPRRKPEGCAGKTGGGGGRGNPGKRMEACGCYVGEPLRYEPEGRWEYNRLYEDLEQNRFDVVVSSRRTA